MTFNLDTVFPFGFSVRNAHPEHMAMQENFCLKTTWKARMRDVVTSCDLSSTCVSLNSSECSSACLVVCAADFSAWFFSLSINVCYFSSKCRKWSLKWVQKLLNFSDNFQHCSCDCINSIKRRKSLEGEMTAHKKRDSQKYILVVCFSYVHRPA